MELSAVLIQPTKLAPEEGLAAKVVPTASTIVVVPDEIVLPPTATVPKLL